MTTVNPVAAPQVSTVFRGKNKLPKILNDILAQNTKIIKELPPDPDLAMIERMNGMAYAAQAVNIRLMNELMAGHTDFVAGAKEYLAKDAAKNAYKK